MDDSILHWTSEWLSGYKPYLPLVRPGFISTGTLGGHNRWWPSLSLHDDDDDDDDYDDDYYYYTSQTALQNSPGMQSSLWRQI